jgi:hypothetical protein
MSEHKGESSAQVWDSRMWQGLMKWVADEQYVERRRIVAGEAQKNIQALLAEDKLDELTLDDFNEYVWKFGEIMGPDGAIGSQEAEQSYSPEELRESFQSGELRVTGQHTVGGGVRIYYPAFKGSDQEKTQLLRRTLHELLYSSDDLYANLDAVKAEANGFGENWATMILCMMHTDEMGIMNGKSKEAVRKLAGMLGVGEGWEEPVDDYHAFNELVAQMRDASGGALQDLLAVDAFLNRVADLGEPQYWKVALSPQASFHEELVDMCVEEGCAAIGFLEKPDDHSVKRFREIRPGDYVVMHTKASIGGVGRVTRPYYETGGDYVVGEISHFQRRIDVDWLIGTYPYGDAFPGAKQRDTVATLDDTVFWRLASNYADDPRFREVLGEAPDFRYWVFQGNPKLWDFEEMLSRATPFQENWTTSKYREEMSEGDTVYIWQSGEQAGIYAVARIVSEPYEVTNAVASEAQSGPAHQRDGDHPPGARLELPTDARRGRRDSGDARSDPRWHCHRGRRRCVLRAGGVHRGNSRAAREEEADGLLRAAGHRQNFRRARAGAISRRGRRAIKPQSVPVGEDSYEVSYPVLAGSFMRFCERASEDSDRIYTFIIDEINRGQIAKIFGELMYLLEYREDNIQLAYTKSEGDETLAQFAIPDNVRIIGTMNTADRSIALVDFALRRRFAFYPFYPDDDSHVQGMLEHWLQKRSPEALWIADFAERLNELLGRDVGRDFLVGHSYFMDAEGMGEEQLREVWRFQIEPLLHEYFVGKDNKLGAYDLDQLIAEAKGVTPEADGEDEAGEPLGDSEAEEEEPAGAEDQ